LPRQKPENLETTEGEEEEEEERRCQAVSLLVEARRAATGLVGTALQGLDMEAVRPAQQSIA
jgi:hypothetical protein